MGCMVKFQLRPLNLVATPSPIPYNREDKTISARGINHE